MSLVKLTIIFIILITLSYLGNNSFDKIKFNEPSFKSVYEINSTVNINLSEEDWSKLFKDKNTSSVRAKVMINDSETVEAMIRFGGQSTRESYSYNAETKDLSKVTLHARIHRWQKPNIDFKISPFDNDPSMIRLKFAHDLFSDIFALNRGHGFIPRANFTYVNVPPAPTYVALIVEPIDKTFFEIRNYPRILHKSKNSDEIMMALRRDLFPRYKDYFEEGYLLTYILIDYYLNNENPLLSYGDSENYDLYFDSYSKKNYPIPNDLDAVMLECNKDPDNKWNVFNENRYEMALKNLYENSDNKKELSYIVDAIYTKLYTEDYGRTLADKNVNIINNHLSQYKVENYNNYLNEFLMIQECQRERFNRLINRIRLNNHFTQ